MRIGWLSLVAAVVVGVAAAEGGSWVVRQTHHKTENLHDVIHERFTLNPQEKTRLQAAEARYDGRRAQIEADIRAANLRLAAAIKLDPELSQEALTASAAVETSAGELQRATLQHVFEMRSALDPAHRPAYDAVLIDALTQGQ